MTYCPRCTFTVQDDGPGINYNNGLANESPVACGWCGAQLIRDDMEW